MRLLVRLEKENTKDQLGFHGPPVTHLTHQNLACPTRDATVSRDDPIPRPHLAERESITLLGVHGGFPSVASVTRLFFPPPNPGILTRFPFGK